jgi:DNA-binding response OmpR family regulator
MMNQVEIKKILIADSQLNYTVGLRKGLTEAGYEVYLAEDGDKALALARSIQPSLILSEVNLPQLNGRTLLRILRSEPELYHIPLLFISNLKRTEERIETIAMGADDYIAKPYYVEEVIARIEMILAEVQPGLFSVPPNAFSGKLSEMNVVDLIQTLEVGQKSGILVLNRNGQQGEIHVQAGAVTDARYETYSPEAALDKMFTWTEGRFRVQLTELQLPKTIKLSNNVKLMMCSRSRGFKH